MNASDGNTAPLDLIARKLSGNASPEEIRALESWIKTDSANSELYKQYLDLWKRTGSIKDPGIIDLDKEWERFSGAVNISSAKRRPSAGRIMIRLAAALLAGFILGYSSFLAYRGIKYDRVRAIAGIETVKLPDGSIVTLNEGSSLQYPKVFRDNRSDIKLKGEGFFEVVSDPDRRFSVESGDIVVEVLGTSFNIDASNENKIVSVVVSEGKVAVYNLSDNIIVKNLVRGEKAVYSPENEELLKTVNTDINFDSYKTRHIIFNNSGIDDVINTLNRVFHKQFRNDLELSDEYKLTVTFEEKDLDYILKTIEATLGFSIKKEGDLIIFR